MGLPMWCSPKAEKRTITPPINTVAPRVIYHRSSGFDRPPPFPAPIPTQRRSTRRRHIIPVDEEYLQLALENETQVNAMGDLMRREQEMSRAHRHEELRRQLDRGLEQLNNGNQARIATPVMRGRHERENDSQIDRQRYSRINSQLGSHIGTRSPVLNLGISEDGMNLEISRREAMGIDFGRAVMYGERLSGRPPYPSATNLAGGRSGQYLNEPRQRTQSFVPAARYISVRNTAQTPEADDRDIAYYRGRLGYREQSPDAGEDTWEPLVSTITMDRNIPSTSADPFNNSTRGPANTSDINPCDTLPAEEDVTPTLGSRMRRTASVNDLRGDHFQAET